MNPRIKVCCIASKEEAQMAIKAGADAIGLVGRMPSGPGPIEDDLINSIARSVSPPIATFLLTCETDANKIAEHHYRTNTNTIQLVDAVAEGTYKKLREIIPAIKIVQVIHVRNKSSIDEAVEISESVDALLLDSGNPSLKIKELGGTGRVHDWELSKKIVQQSKVPVFLAGGLNPDNAREAYEKVLPFGLDLCSGIRTDGNLDQKKLDAFFNAVFR